MKALFGSRKFKLTAGAVVIILGSTISGQITWAQAVPAIVAAISANVLGIAIEDHGTKVAGG
ncbi:MAG: hypothetical protein ABFE07_06250 [Armatimonadia bacterium]